MRPTRPRTLSSPARTVTPGLIPAGALNGVAGTAASPSPQPLANPAPAIGQQQAPAAKQTLARTPPSAQRPNSGGTITTNLAPGVQNVRTIDPDAGYSGPTPTGFQRTPDTMQAWRGGQAARPSPFQAAAPVNRPDQTERANPLADGGGTPQPEGTTETVRPPSIDPSKALGFSQKGNRGIMGTTPAARAAAKSGGQMVQGDLRAASDSVEGDLAGTTDGTTRDASTIMKGQPQQYQGGFGQFSRSFSSPAAAKIYHDYVRNLFGNDLGSGSSSVASAPSRASADQGDESDYG